MNETDEGFASAISEAVDKTLEGNFILGYAVVAECMTPDGNRWLTVTSGSGTNEDIPPWQVRGYLNEALNHWDFDSTEDDEE